jgi:uncharacterized membrane protein
MAHVLHDRSYAGGAARIRTVDVSRPFTWLRQGWADFTRLRNMSMTYGVLIAVAGFALLGLSWGATYLVPAFVGGFLLVAPFAAIGVYALAQQLESGGEVSLPKADAAWRRNAGQIALFGLILALALLLWERTAAIVFALSFGGRVPDLGNLLADVLFSGEHLALLAAFVSAGAVFALAVFTLSVVSAPMLLDRPVDAITAVLTSMRCCIANPAPMLVWAALIAILTAVGFATLMIGLIVIFPWLAFASWHAYRDLVE